MGLRRKDSLEQCHGVGQAPLPQQQPRELVLECEEEHNLKRSEEKQARNKQKKGRERGKQAAYVDLERQVVMRPNHRLDAGEGLGERALGLLVAAVRSTSAG
jgi:hypothetical protein